jgi:hypothetical protein
MSVEPSSTEDEQLAGGIDADLDESEARDARGICIDGITIDGNEQSKVPRRNGDGGGRREDEKETERAPSTPGDRSHRASERSAFTESGTRLEP